jgi:hypothetical protein
MNLSQTHQSIHCRRYTANPLQPQKPFHTNSRDLPNVI